MALRASLQRAHNRMPLLDFACIFISLCNQSSRPAKVDGNAEQHAKKNYHSLGTHDTIPVARLVDAALQLPHDTRQSLVAILWDQLVESA